MAQMGHLLIRPRHTPALATLTQLGYEMQRIATTENASPIAVR